MRGKHTDQEKELAVSSYRDGVGMREIFDTYHVGYRKLRKWLDDADVTIRNEGTRMEDVDMDDVKRLVDEGLNESEISRRMGKSRGIIRRRKYMLGLLKDGVWW